MMKQVRGCRLVGEPTYGSSGNPQPHDLGDGLSVLLPSWKDYLPDGAELEGRGIQPDLLVRWTSGGDTDPVLEAAVALRTRD